MSTINTITDELLVMSCQDGDEEAISLLVRRWQPRLWRHARTLTGTDDAAWDVVQESWLAIVRGLHRLLDAAQFRVWAYRIVTNKSADWIRRQTRRRQALADLSQQDAAQSGGTQTGIAQPDVLGRSEPEAAASHNEQVAALQQALQTLGPDHRVVLTLHYLEEMTINEIAVSLGIPAGTVKSRLYHARQELKDAWQNQQPAALPKKRISR